MALIPNDQEDQAAPPVDGAPQPDAQAAPAAAPGGGKPDAMAQFQRIVIAVGKVVYDKATSARLMQMVKTAGDPVAGVAQAALVVLDQIRSQVKGMNPDFVYSAAPIAAGMILELAEGAKLVQFDKGLIGQVVQAMAQSLQARGGPKDAAPAAGPAPEETGEPAEAGAPEPDEQEA